MPGAEIARVQAGSLANSATGIFSLAQSLVTGSCSARGSLRLDSSGMEAFGTVRHVGGRCTKRENVAAGRKLVSEPKGKFPPDRTVRGQLELEFLVGCQATSLQRHRQLYLVCQRIARHQGAFYSRSR